jgi:two-component system phosphate regulon response regulator OmpR
MSCNNSGLRYAATLSTKSAMAEPRPPRIIVVDDDADLRSLTQKFLSGHGFVVRTVPSGSALDTALQREPADAIVLDLMMPGEDGLSVCRRLRAAGDTTPILMLTARGEPVDRIIGLEMGADDYLGKPFLPRELVARLSAILRRTGPRGLHTAETPIRFGPFELNVESMVLLREGTPVPLSSREFALLAALAASPGRPLSRAQLIERALGRDAEVTDRAIDVQVTRLRKALGENPADPAWIKTVWSVGYLLAGVESC